MDINYINEILIKNDKITLFYYGLILILVISVLQKYENLYKYLVILLVGYFIIKYINKNIWDNSEEKIVVEKKKIPKLKNCKKLNKKIVQNLDNEIFLKNLLMNLSYFKKYDNNAIRNIIKKISKFSKINKKTENVSDIFASTSELKYDIDKLRSLKNIIINDIHSIVYSLPSVQGLAKNTIFLEPLNDKIIYCLNKFIRYSNQIIANKIRINNLQFKNHISNSSKFIDEVNLPQPYNS